MNWQPPTTSSEPTDVPATPQASPPTAEQPTETAETSVPEAASNVERMPDPLIGEPEALVGEIEAEIAPEAPVTQVDDVVEELIAAGPAASPEKPAAFPAGTIHVFETTSRRPIDQFIAACYNDIGRLIGTKVNSGRRGSLITLIGITPTGVQRATIKGETTEIPLAALEWAIKQLYWNGELTRSKMTESYKENGSTVASGVFQILGNCKYFEATESPLTLHFYRLQWEEEQAG